MHDQDDVFDFDAALGASDFSKALGIAESRLKDVPESAEWLSRLGKAHVAAGRFSEALQAFDKAVCAAPEDVESLLAGAVLLSDLGFYDEAQTRFDAASDIAFKSVLKETRGHGTSARLHEGQNNASVLTACPSFKQKLADRHLELGELYSSAGLSKEAETEFTKSQELAPSPETFLLHAQFQLRQARPDVALRHLELARRMQGARAEIHALAAQCYLMLGLVEEATEAVSRLEVLDEAERAGQVLRHLLARPQGAPGLDALQAKRLATVTRDRDSRP